MSTHPLRNRKPTQFLVDGKPCTQMKPPKNAVFVGMEMEPNTVFANGTRYRYGKQTQQWSSFMCYETPAFQRRAAHQHT